MAKKSELSPVKTGWLGRNWLLLLTGFLVGAAAILLNLLGNPGNMGFCIACFERDIAGALGLHSAAPVQYFRPEIVGIVLGSLLMALARREFKGKGGSAPALRFGLGALVMIGALVFLGCPLRMVIRIGGGDLKAFCATLTDKPVRRVVLTHADPDHTGCCGQFETVLLHPAELR